MALKLPLTQPGLDGFCAISDAVEKLANDSGDAERGAIFTRREVVDFILDLAGFTQDRPLYKMRLLEPSFGGGEFLLAAVTRLFASYDKAGRVGDLTNCIRAVELHQITYIQTKSKVLELLASLGLDKNEALRLADAWLVQSDYLLTDLLGKFDFVVGNPPYVRQELIPSPLLAEYRRRYQSLYDRADLYIPFIERSLRLLGEGGQLAFICADRWTKNKYGGPLRSIVAGGFHLRAYVDMVDTPAFDSDVIAYPAITLIARANPGTTLVAKRPSLEAGKLRSLAKVLRLGKSSPELNVSLVECAGRGAEPWILSSSAKRALLRRLESNFPTLEDAGCKVGIGVATGADKVFIAPMVDLDVEVSRKVPLATTKDISGGEVSWLGLAVINPFDDDGKLVDLDRYPKLRHYLAQHREAIANRHVAKKNPSNWYRTIDRISPELAGRPKLLIPDIKGSAHVVFEPGKLYPHHNLYYVISDDWDLRALQAVLLSKVAQQFIAAYSTAMRGGFLRFQAQYLRRIRLPLWTSVSKSMQSKLIKAAVSRDLAKCDQAAYELYGFSSEEIELLAE